MMGLAEPMIVLTLPSLALTSDINPLMRSPRSARRIGHSSSPIVSPVSVQRPSSWGRSTSMFTSVGSMNDLRVSLAMRMLPPLSTTIMATGKVSSTVCRRTLSRSAYLTRSSTLLRPSTWSVISFIMTRMRSPDEVG